MNASDQSKAKKLKYRASGRRVACEGISPSTQPLQSIGYILIQ